MCIDLPYISQEQIKHVSIRCHIVTDIICSNLTCFHLLPYCYGYQKRVVDFKTLFDVLE